MIRRLAVVIARVAVCCALASASAAAGVHHDLDVTLDPVARSVVVTDQVTVTADAPRTLVLSSGVTVSEASADGQPVPVEGREGALVLTLPEGAIKAVIRYGASLAPFDPAEPGPAAGEEGVFLPAGGGWIPATPGEPPTWRLSVRVPAPYVPVATGALIEEAATGDGARAVFAEERTVEEPSLFAGPWAVTERWHGGIRLRTYLHPEQSALSADFLDDAAAAIDAYGDRIGPYPFAGFAVVSAPLPVGYGFPALTYIGRRVLPLPFVRGQSLRHEVLHSWWGNGVRVAPGSGNWSEGLTTAMADLATAEARGGGAARAMRLDWLRDYAALPAEREEPVDAFVAKRHDAGQIVGYGKAAYVFHMLRHEIGDAAFDAGVRGFWDRHRFQAAGWEDLERAFADAAGRDLSAFFDQWIRRTGAPALSLGAVDAAAKALTLTVRQSEPAYALTVPVAVETTAGSETHAVRLSGTEATATLSLSAPPVAVAVDPDFHLFRRLAPGEAPSILRDVTLAEDAQMVVADDGEAGVIAAALAERVMDGKARVVAAARADRARPLLVVGTGERVRRVAAVLGLPPVPEALAGRGTARVWMARTPAGAPVLTIAAVDADALGALLRPLPHYGRQSWLVFDGSAAVDRGVWPSAESPLQRALR